MHSKLLMALFALLMTASLASAATLDSASPMGNGGPGVTTSRDVTLFCQMPDPAGTGLSSQIDLVYPFDSGCADDYVAASGTSVDAMDWWGQYWNYPVTPGTVDYYVVTFYLDNGACYPGALHSTQEVHTFTETYDVTNGWYAVSANITPVAQTAGQRYWVEVQGVMVFTDEGQWGWQTCIAEGGDCGAPLQGFPLLDIPYWTVQPYVGMAFCLYSVTTAVEDATMSSVKSLY